MLAEGRRVGLPACARPVNARGEALPLGDDSIDVAWISAAFHHIADQERCAAELARALRGPGSLVMIRGLFAGRSDGGWHSVFPNADRATDRFPRLDAVADLFAQHGLTLAGVEAVANQSAPGAEVAAWVREMRHADTLLLAFDDDEIAAGLAVLDARATDRFPGPTVETAVLQLTR
jgi:SAM-dependent methyltransferase